MSWLAATCVVRRVALHASGPGRLAEPQTEQVRSRRRTGGTATSRRTLPGRDESFVPRAA